VKLPLEAKSRQSGLFGLGFCPVDIQNAWNDKQNLAFKKMAYAYVYDGAVDASKAALGMGISRDFSVGIS